MKSLPTLLAQCQEIFNRYVKLRDAGHFYPVGSVAGLRFDEDNAHGQCVLCNRFRDGSIESYAINLELKLGPVKFHNLVERAADYKKHGHKFSRSEVEEYIKYYRSKIKELEEKF